MSESFPRIEYVLRSLSAVVHLPYQRWCDRKGCVSFHSGLGMLLSWCPGLKSTCFVISASQHSLVIAHDIAIFVAAFRRDFEGCSRERADAIMSLLVSGCVHVGVRLSPLQGYHPPTKNKSLIFLFLVRN